jgi:hypothetical protein
MNRKPGRVTMTKQHALTLRGVLLWLEQQPTPDPLELDVLTAIVERVEHFAAAGAIVRIRVKNLGAPPSEKKLQACRASLVKARHVRFGFAAPEWTAEEDARLRHLWGETETPSDEIAEWLGRPNRACQERAMHLGVRRMAWHHASRLTPLGRARAVIARRNAIEALRRREEAIGD